VAIAPYRARYALAGFTLLELLMVVALIGISSGLVSLALRDSPQNQLEKEATRMVTLLEVARSHSRAQGVEVLWKPSADPQNSPEQFQFLGLNPKSTPMGIDTVWPTRWLNPDVQAAVWAREALSLGPEPYIGPQKLILKLKDQQISISTDGFSSFKVEHEG